MRKVVFLILPAILLASGAVRIADRSGQADKPLSITIRNRSFSPSSLTIRKGQTVVWINYDEIDHVIESEEAGFESPTLKYKAKFSFTFRRAGNYPYCCRLHPREKGLVRVQ